MHKLSQVFRNYLYYLVLILFVFIPLYPKIPVFNVPGTYVAIRLEDMLIAATTLIWFIVILPEIKTFFRQAIVQSMLLFWLVGGISLFSAIFLTHTVTPHLGLLHYLRRIEVMMLFFVAISAFSNKNQVKTWLKVMLLVTLAVVIYGFGQQWFSFPVISTTNREFSKGLLLKLTADARVNSTFAGHYDLAAYLAIFLTVISVLFFYFKKWYEKIILFVVLALSFVLLTLTAARVSFFAAIIAVTSGFWLIRKRWLILIIMLFCISAFAISPELRHRTIATLTVNLLEGGGPKYIPPEQKKNPDKDFSIENAATKSASLSGIPVDIAPGEPINTTELGVYRSFGIRLYEEWPRAIRAFLKNPLIGTGYSSITISTDNDYLRSLGETGLLGTISFFLVWFVIVKKFFQFLSGGSSPFIKNNSKSLGFYLIIGLFCTIIAVLLNALFIDILESSKIAQLLWLSLGVGFATIKLEKDEKNI